MAITTIGKSAKLGIYYFDSAKGVVATGTPHDRAIADPTNTDGILILSPDQSNSFYMIANVNIRLELHTGTIIVNQDRQNLLRTLSVEIFSNK